MATDGVKIIDGDLAYDTYERVSGFSWLVSFLLSV